MVWTRTGMLYNISIGLLEGFYECQKAIGSLGTRNRSLSDHGQPILFCSMLGQSI